MKETLSDILNYFIGDDIYWFKISSEGYSQLYTNSILPGHIELVHDSIKEIKDGNLCCWHTTKRPHEIWGKSREEAWETLKQQLQQWGALE